ncbi:MAG TPA: hypothetical protein VE860_03295, partial [Chthoniobacterales bacterium]|nr:hypothetical protein [Chthoniobacterales bacterium]
HTAFQRKEILKPAPVIPILFEVFELLRLNFAQFGEEFSNREWTPMDTNRSVQFVFIRGSEMLFLEEDIH